MASSNSKVFQFTMPAAVAATAGTLLSALPGTEAAPTWACRPGQRDATPGPVLAVTGVKTRGGDSDHAKILAGVFWSPEDGALIPVLRGQSGRRPAPIIAAHLHWRPRRLAEREPKRRRADC